MLNSNRKTAKLRNIHPLICSAKFLNKKFFEAKFSNKNFCISFIRKESRKNIFLKTKVKYATREFFSAGTDTLSEMFCFKIFSHNNHVNTNIQT